MSDQAGPLLGGGPVRRVARSLERHPRLRLAGLLTPPLGWLGVLYLGSLALLLAAAFWHYDSDITFAVTKTFTLENFSQLIADPVYRGIAGRTILIALLVTVTDAVLALPIAFVMGKLAGRRLKAILGMAVLMPLWTSYLVKILAWRLILSQGGLLNWLLQPFHLSGPGFGDVAVYLVLSYIWLPYMILPLAAGFERLPTSLLEASTDLGARTWATFRHVVIPLVFPALIAGSIFTFSLTLGDYIAVSQVSSTQFIGSVVYSNQGVSGDLPLAAAFAMVPVAVMLVYLALARRAGAFQAL
ncbi:MAG: ABC transporter permease [Candidatus Dormibacteraeota bacterium]|uniref:ABC transporter permease n=1 Tax=Candidatus Aeolococcus gillhamiae TaxID=3127015 RepID=A0A2W5Z1T6_9BACT|nr:ABC transporter permease [Candidatus Dormibacteraeota bacterium]PZR79309.1 MAG: spermidine/putrescine ABC transporter permease [Candidatus Dormibacter sp. RRmetagenome_bin12]